MNEKLPEWLVEIEETLNAAAKVLKSETLTPMQRLLALVLAQHEALELTDHTSHADPRWRICQRARRLWEGEE